MEVFDASINFIKIWIKMLYDSYDARRVAYRTSMKEIFKQIPITMTKPLSSIQKLQKVMSEICGGW